MLPYKVRRRKAGCSKLSLFQQAPTGFPVKEAHFSKLKNIPALLSDDKEGEIIFNILAIGRLFWETLYLALLLLPVVKL